MQGQVRSNAREAALPAGGLIDERVGSDSEDTRFRRTSKDVTVNEFGRYLLCVCQQFDLIILNGLMPGDEDGKFTYMAHNGSSTIDYFICRGVLFIWYRIYTWYLELSRNICQLK